MTTGSRIAISGLEGLDGYTGAKAGAGVYQTIINEMPPHTLYIECCVGSGIIARRKRPAASTIVIDADAAVIDQWKSVPGVTAIHGCAVELLPRLAIGGKDVLVYADPPYLVRSCQRDYYRHEFKTPEQHAELLKVLKGLQCHVMLSGYRGPLYDAELRHWRRIDYQTATHAGAVTESLWLNFKQPMALHDYSYLGKNFTDRQRIKRKKARFLAKLRKMSMLERGAILEAVRDLIAESD